MNDPKTKDTDIRHIFQMLYCLVLVVPFFWQLLILLGLSVAFPIQAVFRPFLLGVGAVAVTGLWLTGRKRAIHLTLDAGILLLAFCWMIVVFLLHRHILEEASLILQRAAIAWLIFYPFGFLLDTEETRKNLAAISACWTAVMTLLAGIGIWCAVTGTVLENLSGNPAFGMMENRLQLGIWATSTSENILTGFMLATVGLYCSKRNWQRGLYAIAMAVLFLAMALTDGRNGIISIGVFVGAIAFVVLHNRFEKKNFMSFCACAAVAAICIFAIYAGSVQLQKGFPSTYHQIKSLRPAYLASAVPDMPVIPEENWLISELEFSLPEEQLYEETVSMNTHRKIDITLNGRSEIWQSAIDAFRSNADNILLIGRPGSLYLETFRKNAPIFWRLEHLHNIYLQGIAEYGIPGGLLMLAFLSVFVTSGWNLIFARSGEMWKRFLPIPAVVILISELVDAFTRFGQDNMVLYVLFLFMGLAIRYGWKNDK